MPTQASRSMRIHRGKVDGRIHHKGTVKGHSKVTHLLSSLLHKLYYVQTELTKIVQHISFSTDFFKNKIYCRMESFCHLLAIYSATLEMFTSFNIRTCTEQVRIAAWIQWQSLWCPECKTTWEGPASELGHKGTQAAIRFTLPPFSTPNLRTFFFSPQEWIVSTFLIIYVQNHKQDTTSVHSS